MSDNKQMMFILSGRADYIWNGDGIKYDHWVFNQKWMVITYIYFDNEYSMFVLTCYDNIQGYNKLTIHPYMKPSHIIMSKLGAGRHWHATETSMKKRTNLSRAAPIQ